MQKKRDEGVSVIWEEEKNRPVSHAEMQRRNARRAQRRKRAKRIRRLILLGITLCLLLMILGLWRIGSFIWKWSAGQRAEQNSSVQIVSVQHEQEPEYENPVQKPELTEDFLTPNEFSRPQEKMLSVEEIYIHYTANPGTSAAQNRSYFENLGITGETSASAHFVIGYEGEIVQCLPLDEIGYAVMEHNYNSVSIECCYLDENGAFTEETYQSLIELTAWLLGEYELDVSAVKRHYDASGKLCPLYYVEHEEAWDQLKGDVETYLEAVEME